MKNLNTVLLNAELTVVDRTTNAIQAFASAQNTIRVTAPYGQSWVPYAIFEAVGDRSIGEPTQRLRMKQVGFETVGGEQYAVYETDVPSMVQASARATKVELVVSFWAKQTTTYSSAEVTFVGVAYFETTPTNAELNALFDPDTNDYVRVIVNGTSTDWVFDGSTWVDTEDILDVVIQENRSDVIDYNLRRGKSSLQPTSKPENTEAILAALQGKANVGDSYTKVQADGRFVNVDGDVMSGALIIDNNLTVSGTFTLDGMDVKDVIDNTVLRVDGLELDVVEINDNIGSLQYTEQFVVANNQALTLSVDELDKEAKRQDLRFIDHLDLEGSL